MNYEVKPVGLTIATGGDGLWSSRIADVKINSIQVDVDDEDEDCRWCYVNVYFDQSTWNDSTNQRQGPLINRSVGGDGLIYTDRTWLRNLRKWFISQGMTKYAASLLDYTEQGMQDEGMVSLEAGLGFAKNFDKVFAKRG